MKEIIIISIIISIYSTITTPIFKKDIVKSEYFSENNIEVAIADDLWDYFTRFRINN
tara:strand:+ start:1393 stop:1563 length:171 start_codon:yes stop_codon:yes gene_type:complete